MKNKKDLKKISQLLREKSTVHLRLSMVILFSSLLMLGLTFTFIRSQYKQIEKNFVKNVYTHIIEVSGKCEGEINYIQPSVMLKNEVENYLEKWKIKDSSSVFCIYNFGFGFDTDKEIVEDINVFGIDEAGEKFLLKNVAMEDNVIYSTAELPSSICLCVPHAFIDGENLYLDGETFVDMTTKKIEKETVFQVHDGIELQTYYVNNATYKEIYKLCVGEEASEESFKKNERLQPIYKVFVYIDDISDVERIAKKMDEEGLLINYVFQSFDDIGEAMNNSIRIMTLFSFFLFIFAIVNLVLSWKSFIKLQSKDIGIMKQMGYSEDEITYIFGRNIKRVFWILTCFVNVVIICVSMFVLGLEDWFYLCMFVSIITLFMTLLENFIVHVYLKRQVKQGVIALLKINRQFE